MITDPAGLPADHSVLDGDTLIGPAVWAVLQGVQLSTVYRSTGLANKRRAAGTPKPGDMPEPAKMAGQTPLWTVSAYREWEVSRPGRGAGSGRPRKHDGPRMRPRVDLPVECPHCHREITEADLRR